MRGRTLVHQTVAALMCVLAGSALRAQTSITPSLRARLDSIVRAGVSRIPLAGASVVVLHNQDTLLLSAYGEAELGLHVPTSAHTRYRWVTPGNFLLTTALMQLVDRGVLALDDDAAKYLPDFPWQGRHVTVRELMQSTSGLPDYRYLGDVSSLAWGTPKRPDEVTTLFAGRPFIHEPGERWVWTSSGFHLAGTIIERLTGEPYAEHVARTILRPAGAMETVPCDDETVIPDLARGYQRAGDRFVRADRATGSLMQYVMPVCGTALDVARVVRAMPRLLTSASLRVARGLDGRSVARDRSDSTRQYAIGLDYVREDGHRWWGMIGGYLLGTGGSVMDFADDSLIVVVLANTQVPGTGQIARQLARAALGLSPLPEAPAPLVPSLDSLPVSGAERARLVGTYRVTVASPEPQDRQWVRTIIVYEHAGRLMMQRPGNTPEPMLRQADGSFVVPGTPGERWHFTGGRERAETATSVLDGRVDSVGRRVSAIVK